MHVKGKVCVVTGAASGIGAAVARAYADAGMDGEEDRGVPVASDDAEEDGDQPAR